MDVPALFKMLFGDKPFFEGATLGFQGDVRRHIFMASAIATGVDSDRPLRLLEIGSWVGCSALTFAQAMGAFSPKGGSILCVDSWQPYLSSSDRERTGYYTTMAAITETDLAFELFRHNTRHTPPGVTIAAIRGAASDILPTLEPESFDVIYIDGSHYYDECLADLRNSDRLLADGGILCGDDLERQLGDFDQAEALANRRVDFMGEPGYHPGVSLAVGEFFGRRISNYIGFWVVRKSGGTYEDVSLNGVPTLIPAHFNHEKMEECRVFVRQPD